MSGQPPSHAQESREGDLELLRSLLFRGPIARDVLAQVYADAHDVDLESADRRARQDIEQARLTTDWGQCILPNPYRLARTADDIAKLRRFLGSERRRALSILLRVRRQRRGLDRIDALPLRQGEMFR